MQPGAPEHRRESSPFRSVIITVFTREINPRVPRGAFSLKLGAIAALVPAALILTSCSGNTSNPNKPVVSGVKPRAFVSNAVAGVLQIVNAGKDSLVTTKSISAGSQPGPMVLSADKRFTYVFDAGTNSIAVINNSTEAQSASISLPGATESFVISPKGNRGFAAIPTATVLGQAAGVVQVMNLITNTATFVLDIPQARRVVINHSGSRALVFSDSADFFTVIDASLVGVPGAQPLTTINSNPGDRPVGAVFSDDDNTAYILNCGSECGGGTPSVTAFNMQNNTLGATVGLSGATVGLLNNGNLYVAGGASGVGTLQVVKIPALTASVPFHIGDGFHNRMELASDNKLFVGAHGCNLVTTGCLSIFDVSANTAVVDPPNGDVTGIAPVSKRSIAYVCEGGELRILDTTTSAPSKNAFIDIIGQAFDVKEVD